MMGSADSLSCCPAGPALHCLGTHSPLEQVRKLEFILAEVKAAGHDSVITIGGIQSNHARATAVAARYLGLEVHLLL